MENKVSCGLKVTFLVHFIVGIVFGLVYLLIPVIWGKFIGWTVNEPWIYRLLGAAILGFATSSWFGYRETAWEKVKIVIRMEIVWTILGTIVMILGMTYADLPKIGWVNAGILAGFAIAFSVFYSPKEEEQKAKES